MIQDSAWEVGYWSGGAPAGKKSPSSGRSPIPARRPSRVGSRRDPSDGRVNLVVPFSIPLPRKGVGAFIVSVVDHSYLVTLLLLWLTMSSYPSTTLAVHVVRRAFAGRGWSTLPVSGRLYDHWRRPYLHPAGCPCRVGHVGGPTVRRYDDVAAKSAFVISFFPPPGRPS
ncbi:hypothetical protein B296_00035733 [Ensete ventricosum]|uniref:Uncharacterized protein n=1 Tax=Ensete ventricosum TaxID=4639 RepID=A0A426ZNI5_ENSVE|nr:hypothetical protein B296_00035733 [Ensete ventricosum]